MAGFFALSPMSPRNALTLSWLLVWSLIAFIWAFAEAIWFFIIFDVIVSLAIMRFGVVKAMMPAFAAFVGALLGGVVLYKWAQVNPETVKELLLTVPGITEELYRSATYDMAEEPLEALVLGGFTGVPFKLFAGTAFDAGIAPLTAFLEPAAVARFARLIVVFAVFGLLRTLLYNKLRRVGLLRLTLFLWVLFYAWFGYVFWNIV